MPARRRKKPTRSKRARIYGVRRWDRWRSPAHGWFVSLMRNGRTFNRLFSDGVHGGRSAALQAALRYRDRVVREHPPISRREYSRFRRRNNRSGVTGVYKVAMPRPRKGGDYQVWYWAATWTPRPGGPFQRKSFSVKKYGEAGAFRRALAARRRGLAKMEAGARITHPGQAPRGRRKR